MPKGKKDDKPIHEEKFQQIDVNAKDPRTVVLMLDSPEVGVVCKACQSLQQYMEKSELNRSEIHSLGVVPKLIKLLNSADKVVYACAVVTLAVMIPNLSVRRSLLKLDCLPALFKILKPDEEVYSIERGVFIIANLAEEYTFKNRIVEENGCQLLLPLLSHTDCDILKHSLNALSLLTIHNIAKTTIANENGFPALLALLDSEYAEIQEAVLRTLEHCLQDAQCRESFSNSDGLAKITEFLNKQEWNDLHVVAIDVLSLCLVEDHGLEALHSSNCLQKLLQSITDSQLPQMMTKAAKALASASRDTVSKKILHEQNAEKSFIELLSSQDDDVCIAACEGLRGMSTLATSRQYIGQEGGVKSLVSLLQHPSVGVRASAVQTLASVTYESIANCNMVNDADGGMEALSNLLSDESAISQSSAAQCIISMSSSASLRFILIQNNVMEHLAGCLTHTDVQVLSNASRAIALLAVDSIAREKFPVSSISVLLEILSSGNTQVCCDSMWAIAVLAQSKALTDAVFNTKGVETIKRLSEESLHKSVREYAKIAFKRLLSGSPSAKYNLTKSLSPQDILVNTEFWDLGLGEATKFIPLEELVNQTATMNRPVIAVSLMNKPSPPQPTVAENEEESKVKDEVETASTRSKSRQAQHNTKDSGKSKKTKEKLSTERQVSPDDDNASGQDQSPQGLLQPDIELWEDISHVQTNIQNLESVKSQVEALAVYVSQKMGGPILPDNPLQYELPLAEIQGISTCPLVPLGKIKKGTFQHRALLFKVLSDQLGIPSSLHRGQYSRHWNTIILERDELLVDLVFIPSKLVPINSSEALQYQSV